jgi:glycosyltransferase involved in cell wall biosynthesis
MDRSKFSFTVACLSEGSKEFAEELSQYSNVQTFNLDMNRYQIDPLSDVKVLIQLARHIRSGNYDLIHAHASKPGYLARMAAIGTGIPVLYSPHGFSFHQGVNRFTANLFAFLEYLAVPFTRLIIAISNGEVELAKKFRIGSDSLFVVIHTGIDPRPFRISVNRAQIKKELGIQDSLPVVGAIGRLNQQKSPLDFIHMAAMVHRGHPEVHFMWIGTGPLEDDVKTLTQELGLDSVMHFLGQRNDVPALLKTMNCLVLSSHWEGFPLIVLEALASDTPVVATDISGTREAIKHGWNGWLAPAGDYETMAEYVLDILENPERASLFREAGRKRIDEEFTTQSMVSAIESVYLTVLTSPKRSATSNYVRDIN